MSANKKYWRSFEELSDNSLTEQLSAKEFAEEIPVEEFLGNDQAMEKSQTSRRDFLKYLGFSTAAVTLASCEAPIIKSVPYVVKPEEINPGVANYYASAMFNGYDYANVLVKNREGRPIKIERNPSAKHFNATNARVQASVLSLYDSDKVKGPQIGGKDASWKEIDQLVGKALANLGGKKAVILSSSIPSPSTQKLIAEFAAKFPGTEHVVYDALDASNALDAAEEFYGQRALPHYDLSKAELVVAFNADFLGDFQGASLEVGYAKAKKPGKSMIQHIQVESILSHTGANADERMPLKQSEVQKLLADVYSALTGGSASKEAVALAKKLRAKGSKAVVLAEGNKAMHKLSFAINDMLASAAVATGKTNSLRQGNRKQYRQFLAEAKAGNVGALFVFQANPAYNDSDAEGFKAALAKVSTSVAMSEKANETAALCKAIAPVPHWLESWNDLNPATGIYTLQQPTIQRIFDTRQFQDSLLTWMKSSGEVVAAPVETPQAVAESTDTIQAAAAPIAVAASGEEELQMPKSAYVKTPAKFYDYLKQNWSQNILPQLGYSFNKALYEGYNETAESNVLVAANPDVSAEVAQLKAVKAGEWEIQLYTKIGVGDGTDANNPWLQELPDPITRTSWDNYLTVNPLDAEKLNIDIKNNANVFNGRMQFNGDYVKVTANGKTLEKVPVFIQPGQALGTAGLAVGYGQQKAGKVGSDVGVNAYPFIKDGELSVTDASLSTSLGGDTHEFACIQMQNTLMGRYEIAREASLSDFVNKEAHEWNESAVMPTWRGTSPVDEVDLWTEWDRSVGPHFNMAIDLNSCTGCGACIVACQAENNVPVVGKDEIRRSRDMYWLRIDRYYSDAILEDTGILYTQEEALKDGWSTTEPQQYKELIKPGAKNPDVIFQPMMCQHCNHAPCETVCPVAATMHGKQGQNMMTYNRCVGTRYCANNCPYKVRRFNWLNYAHNDKFDFNMNDDLGRMVLNPDVAVRTRGVMEKCSLCIQRTQATILKAKTENRRVRDDEFQTACSAACSTGAITFGDVNDPEAEVVAMRKSPRKYEVLEELGTTPNVFYQVKIRNK